MAIHLGRSLPNASRDRPERRRGRPARQHGCRRTACRSYLVLLPVGFTLPPPLPAARCALTAPFHPCRPASQKGRWARRCVSVALSLGSPPPGVTRHRASVEPGLSSLRPDSTRAKSGHPTVWHGKIWDHAPLVSNARQENPGTRGTFLCNQRFSRVATIGRDFMTQSDEKLSRRAMLRNAAAIVGVAGASALTAGCGSSARTAPPPAPVVPPAPPPIAEPAPPPPPAAAAKESKKEARYQTHPHGRERCGLCTHFVKPHDCELVEGRISPRGWCTHFTAAG